jgi:putative N6-adenine-specific DNA methylase
LSPSPASGKDHQFFAPCARGLEALLAQELAQCGAHSIEATQGGVGFSGDTACGYKANLHSRLANRVLQKLDSIRYRNGDDLYRLANRQPWESLVPHQGLLRVDLNASHSRLRSLNFATLRIKDGIVDQLRKATGDRPSISTRSPDWRVHVFLDALHAHLYLDWSGEALFKRGWRNDDGTDDGAKGEAPLKETLAAALVLLSGADQAGALLDPFCGSGTVLIEAAMIRAQRAPGLDRRFDFEKQPGFAPELWAKIKAQALQQIDLKAVTQSPCIGIDRDPVQIARARSNAKRAGLPVDAIAWSVGNSFHALPALPGGWIVANPPYGERLEAAGSEDWKRFAGLLRTQLPGGQCWLLAADLGLPRKLALRESRKIVLVNGTIECRLFGFPLKQALQPTT